MAATRAGPPPLATPPGCRTPCGCRRTGNTDAPRPGCDRVVVHPYFLFAGNHTAYDIPAALRAAKAQHGSLPWTLTGPLGFHPGLLEVVETRIAEAAADGPVGPATVR